MSKDIKFLEPEENVEASTLDELEPKKYKVVASSLLNIRDTSSKAGTVVSIVPRGSTLIENNSNNDTDEFKSVITEDGIEGFAMSEFLEEI